MSQKISPLVSVIIPTYNHAQYLAKAIRSVLDQSYANLEVIIVDNFSEDETDKVVASFSDKRITYLKINNNGVVAVSRNAGIKSAKGSWIAFLDSDDWWVRDKLRICIKNAMENVDVIYHDLEIVGVNFYWFQSRVTKGRQLNRPALFDLLSRGNALANSSVLVRKKLLQRLGGINEDSKMVGCEDFNTWLRIAKITENFLYIPITLGFYLFHDNNLSHKDMRLPWEYAVRDFIDILPDCDLARVRSQFIYGTGRRAYLDRNYDDAYHHLKNSFVYIDMKYKLKSFYMLCIIWIRFNTFFNEK